MDEQAEPESQQREPIPVDLGSTVVFPARSLRADWGAPGDVGRVRVEVIGGSMDGASARVEGFLLTLGRAADNDLVLHTDPSVSARHARVVREGKHYWLVDLGSRNGTFIGDQRLRDRALIGPGSTFMVGRTRVEFMPR